MILLIFMHLLATVFSATPNYYPEYRSQTGQQNYGGKNVVPIISETNEMSADGTFSYSYATGDGQQVQAQGYLKNAGNKDTEAEVIQGSYSYTAPDGTPITVTYVADELGFRAEGAHLPTPPPIPEAIQKSLELIAQAQGRSRPEQRVYSEPRAYPEPRVFPEQRAYPEQRSYRNNYKSQYQRPFRY